MITKNKTELDGVYTIYPPTNFEDFRGSYVETYNKEIYTEIGINTEFIQHDIATSYKNVLRGIHGDQSTYKLISCLYGMFYLVVVNNDKNSNQFKKWQSFVLSDSNRLQVLVPPKFGNGHLVLSDKAIFHYKQNSNYDRDEQFTIAWNDPEYKFWWPISNPITSIRDQAI